MADAVPEDATHSDDWNIFAAASELPFLIAARTLDAWVCALSCTPYKPACHVGHSQLEVPEPIESDDERGLFA